MNKKSLLKGVSLDYFWSGSRNHYSEVSNLVYAAREKKSIKRYDAEARLF